MNAESLLEAAPACRPAAAVIERLELPVPGYDRLTYPRLRALLSGAEVPAEQRRDVLACGACVGAHPVGLALLSGASEQGQRRLWSVAVAPAYRRCGLGLRLLAASEEAVRAGGARSLMAIHSSRMPVPAAFEALLRRAGWAPPKPVEYRLAGQARWAFAARADWKPFLDRLRARGFAATPWQELTAEDRARVDALIRTMPPAPGLDVRPSEAFAEPAVCVALRRHGEVIGWVIGAHDAREGLCHYSCGYVVPELQRAGWLVGGLVEVCLRQAAAFGPDSLSVYETPAHNAPMIRLMENRIGPRGLWTDVRYQSEKVLRPAEDPCRSGEP